jgi:hypothetical protein
MDDETMRKIIVAFGKKLYELQVGMATMFNLGITSRTFTQAAFDKERLRLESEPDFMNFREAVQKMERANANEFIREAKFFIN